MLPIDSHQVFAGMTDDEQNGILPSRLARNTPKMANRPIRTTHPSWSPMATISGGCRNYALNVHEYYRLRSIYIDLIEAAKKDQSYLKGALADANRMVEYHGKQIGAANEDLQKYTTARLRASAWRGARDRSGQNASRN